MRHSVSGNGYFSPASFQVLIFRTYQTDPGGSEGCEIIETASLGTRLQALPGGKLHLYKLQLLPGRMMRERREWGGVGRTMAQLGRCLPSNHEDLSLDPSTHQKAGLMAHACPPNAGRGLKDLTLHLGP